MSSAAADGKNDEQLQIVGRERLPAADEAENDSIDTGQRAPASYHQNSPTGVPSLMRASHTRVG